MITSAYVRLTHAQWCAAITALEATIRSLASYDPPDSEDAAEVRMFVEDLKVTHDLILLAGRQAGFGVPCGGKKS